MLARRARILIMTLWAGSLWTVGYLVAPTLFATLTDRVLAGTVAASLFQVEAVLSIACALALLALLRWHSTELEVARRRSLSVLALAILSCTVVIYFGLTPIMAGLRAAAGPMGVLESAARTQFGILHGVSSALYLLQSVLAGILIVRAA